LSRKDIEHEVRRTIHDAQLHRPKHPSYPLDATAYQSEAQESDCQAESAIGNDALRKATGKQAPHHIEQYRMRQQGERQHDEDESSQLKASHSHGEALSIFPMIIL